MRESVLDTETTRLKPKGGDRIVEIGCVELVNHIATTNTFHRYINPERSMPEGAFNVHGLSEEFLSDKPVFAEIVDDFVEFVDGATLVIHNAAFDMGFLDAEFQAASRSLLKHLKVIDTLDLARRKHPHGPNSLDALCRRYGVDNSDRIKHGALLDSELLAEVYLELIGGRQPNLTLVDEPGQAMGEITARAAKPRPTPLAPRLTDDEKTAHTAFVATLGPKSIWTRYDLDGVATLDKNPGT